MPQENENVKEREGKKVVWVSCRGEGGGCGGKEAVLITATKTGNQRAINLVRYRCVSCGRMFSVSY